jgi:hypothetical protein
VKPTFIAVLLGASSALFGQTVSQPAIFVRPGGQHFLMGAIPSDEGTTTAHESFSTADLTAPAGGNSQFGVASQVYTLKIYGIPKCETIGGQEVCVERTWLDLALSANVVNSVTTQVAALREYVLSRKGSPLAISAPFHTWTTQKPKVDRQSWFAFSPYGSARFVPVTGGTNKLSGGAAVTAGFTAEAHFEFTATDPASVSGGAPASYPGTLYFSATPTAGAAFGSNLQSAVFGNGANDHFIWGGEYRVGFQFKGEKPISLGITGTYSQKGFTKSHTGMAISLSKLFGAVK